MSRRNRSPLRRKQSRQISRLIVSSIAVLVIVAAVYLIASNSGEPVPEVAAERLTLDPVLGDPDAPVTIVEYGAYGCSACQAWHRAGIIEQILAEYPGRVNFVYRDFPVIAPSYSRMAAQTAQCALDQGNEVFWDFHNAIFTFADARSSQEDLIALGEQVGLDRDTLQACIDANTHAATVQYHEDQGRELGLPGTPAFLVNDQRLFYASPEALRAAVEQALAS